MTLVGIFLAALSGFLVGFALAGLLAWLLLGTSALLICWLCFVVGLTAGAAIGWRT